MERVQNISVKGKNIVLVDLSNTQPHESIAILPAAQKVIASNPPKSAFVLTDVTGAKYNKEVADAIKAFVVANSPYIRASAVAGVEGVTLVLLQTVIFLTRREIKSFNKREEAMQWLADFSEN